MFKVAIIGAKDTEDYNFVCKKCVECLKNKVKTDKVIIYSTGDDYIKEFASRCGISVQYFYADWKKHGNNALKIRNEEMLSDCDAVITFKNDIKNNQMITKMAIEKGLPHRIIK